MINMMRLGAFLAVAISSAALCLAEDADLEKGKKLFERQEYAAAQEALLKVDRSKLSPDEQKIYDSLLKELPVAIAGSRKAEQDTIDADKAFAENKWDASDALYQKVVENKYATSAQRKHADQRRQQIVEKKALEQAARPTGPEKTPLKPPAPAPGTTTTTPPAAGTTTTTPPAGASTTTTPPPAGSTTPVTTSTPPATTPPSNTLVVEARPVPSEPAPQPAPVQPVAVQAPPAAAQPAPVQAAPASPTASSPPPSFSADSSTKVIDATTPAAQTGSTPMQMQAQPTPAPSISLVSTQDVLPATPGTPVDELRIRDQLLWQRAVARSEEAARKAREAASAERWDEARQFAGLGVQLIESVRDKAPTAAEYDAAHAAALAVRNEIEAAYDVYTAQKADVEAREIAAAHEQRRLELERQRREKVMQLFATAEQLKSERRYAEAAEAVRQVRYIDPANAEATFKLSHYEDMAELMSQSELDDTLRRQVQRTLSTTREALVPWDADVLYPKNWVEITERRRGIERGISQGDSGELNRMLESKVTEFEFHDTPFDQLIDYVQTSNALNLSVDWDDLEQAGITRDKPVSIRLSNVKLGTALKEVLSQLGGTVRVGMSTGDGMLRIATQEKLDRDKSVRVFDVSDLLISIPKFKGPSLTLSLPANQSGGMPETLGPSLFRQYSGGNESGDEAVDREHASSEMAAKIMDLIRTNVAPDSWRETGGGDGALRELNGNIIVYNTSEAHKAVSNLLDQLRATRALQIAVESRFLIVTSNFLEEIGVDLDFVLNAGNAGFDPVFTANGPLRDTFTGAQVLTPRAFSSSGVFPGVPPFGGGQFTPVTPIQPYGQPGFVPQPGGVIPSLDQMTPVPISNGSIDLARVGAITTGLPGSYGGSAFNPALNIAGSFLDNLQVDFLIRATQANKRSSVVQAPRLLLFNGQQAYVAIARNRQYVASLNANVAEGAAAVAPVLGNVASGSVLEVEATISHDRRYVTMTVHTTLSDEPVLERFLIQSPSGNSPGLFITLPDQQQRDIRTTCSVPDGGTVLLGGLKQTGEAEVDAGVPMLSKIPVLKRAFTNTSLIKDTQTLLILLKAKILIQREAENEAFPGLDVEG